MATLDLDGPALAPPKDEVSNLNDPPNQNGLAYTVLIICAVITTICFLLRAYGRVYLLKKFQTEEILTTLAYGNYWGAAYATFKMVDTPGYFVHQWNVRLKDVIPTNYWVLIFGVCYSFVLPFLKIAILVEWCRLFVPKGTRTKSIFW
ncbi:hypothetical protein H9Q69_013028 [Fusarium xylarioides]|nr:hypothetical protein H9Q69_013028 [Fusarium xylarioides]